MTKKMVIMISYGDYTIGAGGTDKAIESQQHLLNSYFYEVLFLYPYYIKGVYAFWGVIWNGSFIGVFSNKRLMRLLYDYQLKDYCVVGIIIHHFLGVNLRSLNIILDYCQNIDLFFYLHDYYSICPEKGLYSDNKGFCGFQFPSSDKCKNCLKSGRKINKIIKREHEIHCIFEKNNKRIRFIAPSESIRKNWVSLFPQYEKKVTVLSHQLIEKNMGEEVKPTPELNRIKIAFLGEQLKLKGWDAYVDAVKKSDNKEKFLYYQFGKGKEKISDIIQIAIDFRSVQNSMINSLKREGIHCAVLWSLIPETYSFTYYESLAANCFVITNDKSGNVCDQVLKNGNGIVLNDLSEVFDNYEKLKTLLKEYYENHNEIQIRIRENEGILSLFMDKPFELEKVNKCIDFSTLWSIYRMNKLKHFS